MGSEELFQLIIGFRVGPVKYLFYNSFPFLNLIERAIVSKQEESFHTVKYVLAEGEVFFFLIHRHKKASLCINRYGQFGIDKGALNWRIVSNPSV